MSEQPVVNIHIFGTEYKITSQSNPDHTREVAHYVDRKMREVAGCLSLRSVAKIAVLTAVNLADELLKEEETDRRIEETIVEQTNRLASSTDRTT